MTRINLVQPCVSLVARVCRAARPPTTLNTTQKVLQSWSPLCSGRQVLSGRCARQSGVRFHTSTLWTAHSTPDPEDRFGDDRGGEPGSATHHLLDDPETLPDWQEEEDLDDTEYATVFPEVAMRTLQELFGLSQEDAQYVLLSCLSPNISEHDVLHNLQTLQGCGIQGTQIFRIPWILSHKPAVLCRKLGKIKEPYLFRQHFEGLGFCYLSIEKMAYYQRYFRKEAAKFPHHPNRIYYLAERLQVSVELFTERIGKPHRTLTMGIDRLTSIIDMFHKYGLSPEDIVADLWVFGYCARKGEERLRRATEFGCTELRPWMCRCSDKIFDTFCERYKSGKQLMDKHGSLFGFLSDRLDCHPSLLEKVFESNMVMKKVHINKFSRVLELLFAEGITAKEIRSCMRVFQYSEVRTAARIKELKKARYFPFPLIILCRTPGQFKEILFQHKKRWTLSLD